MDPWLERIFAGKEAMRKKLSKAPIEEKIRMLELMRDRELVLRKVREQNRAARLDANGSGQTSR